MLNESNRQRILIYNALSRALEPILSIAEFAVIGLACGMIGVIFSQVVLRYVFNASFFGAEELARFMFSWFIFLSAALALNHGMHFSVSLLIDFFPSQAQRLIQVLVYLIVICVLIVIIVEGVNLTIQNWRQASPAMQVPLSYPYAAIPVSGLIMVCITLCKLLQPADSGSRRKAV